MADRLIVLEQTVVDAEIREKASDCSGVGGLVADEGAADNKDAILAAIDIDGAAAGVWAEGRGLVVHEDGIDDHQVAIAHVDRATFAVVVAL